MSTVPQITVFVRHTPGCKYGAYEFSHRCTCRKHLRWFRDGKQYRRQAATRSWSEAEKAKRDLEDQLAGRTPERRKEGRGLQDSIALFLQDKQVQGVCSHTLQNHKRDLARLRTYCEQRGVFVVQGITRELLTGFCGTWAAHSPSSFTRFRMRERLSGFLNYCFQARWLERKPPLPRIILDFRPTMPLTAEEYARLLAAVPAAFPKAKTITNTRGWARGFAAKHAAKREREIPRAHAIIQLMRWSGLAVRDASMLERSGLVQDADGIYNVVTSREKTGTDVCVPIPPAIAAELLAVPNANERYFFYSGSGSEQNFAAKCGANIAAAFEAAGIEDVCFMKSHRLRDTFAVDLLEKGVPL